MSNVVNEMTREEKEQRIRDLEAKLADSDYKVRKNIEFEKIGAVPPYDWSVIHNEAQPIRDEINRLQDELDAADAE